MSLATVAAIFLSNLSNGHASPAGMRKAVDLQLMSLVSGRMHAVNSGTFHTRARRRTRNTDVRDENAR
jgi:hypothetical protein